MKSKAKIIVGIIVFLFFVGVIDYPFISRLYNNFVTGGVVSNYDTTMLTLEEQEKQITLAAARAYNEKLASGLNVLTDSFAENHSEDEEYDSLLNINGDGLMGVINIPKINITLPIYHGTSAEVLQQGAGHLEGSSLPVGGESTHAVISAHRGLPRKELFTSLDLLEVGDRFTIKVLGDTLTYEVYEIQTVSPENVEPLQIVAGEDLVTLVTCTPYGINTHRLYVHARRVIEEEAEETVVTETDDSQSLMSLFREYWWIAFTVLLLLWLIFLICLMVKRDRTQPPENEQNSSGTPV